MDLISGLFERQWGARQARRRVEKIRGGVGTCHMLSDREGSGKEGELPSKGNGFLLQGGGFNPGTEMILPKILKFSLCGM